jgi:thioredoxin 1
MLLLATAVGMWCLFVWVPSIVRSKGDGMSKALKILVVAVLILAVAAVVRIKQQGKGTGALQSPSTPAVAGAPGLPRLVDLGSVSCIPCKMMAPILEELKKEYAGRLNVEFYDIVQNPETGRTYSVRVMPTQIFFDATGKERFRHEGFISKDDILAKWKELGVDLSDISPQSPAIGQPSPK